MGQVATLDFQMILLQNYMHIKIQTQMEIRLTLWPFQMKSTLVTFHEKSSYNDQLGKKCCNRPRSAYILRIEGTNKN